MRAVWFGCTECNGPGLQAALARKGLTSHATPSWPLAAPRSLDRPRSPVDAVRYPHRSLHMASKTVLAPLTSLRFVAALLVVAHHYFRLEPGYAGVSFFFVLSGFILAFNYAPRVADRGDF